MSTIYCGCDPEANYPCARYPHCRKWRVYQKNRNSDHHAPSINVVYPGDGINKPATADNDTEAFPEDITRLVSVLASAGYQLTRHQAEDAWCRCSESLCAGWMTLDGYTDAAIVFLLRRHMAQ